MARRHLPPDPELAALARDRLARLMGGDEAGPRRAAGVRGAVAAEVPEGPEALPTGSASPRPGRRVGVDDLEPPRRFTRWHLGVVATVLLLGLVWGGWSWFRARPEAVAAPAGVPVAPSAEPAARAGGSASPPSVSSPRVPKSGAPESGDGAPPQGAQPAGPVVHVLGAGKRPGLVHLGAGARVEDALEAAGGLRRDADPDELNLAQPLEDGVQVVVGTRRHPAGEVRPAGGGPAGGGSAGGGAGGGTSARAGGGSSGSSSAAVDLNRASADQLDTLPGVGPVTAQKILDWRGQHGRFSRVEELQEVDGIGPKTYARLAPHVRV